MGLLGENEILSIIKNNFYRIRALLLGFVLIFLLYVPTDSLIKEVLPTLTDRFILLDLLLILWCFYWLFKKHYLPRVANGKIGIVICIQAENDKQRTRLKEDFARRLTTSISKNKLETIIEVLILDDHETQLMSTELNKYSYLLNHKNDNTKKGFEEKKRNWSKIQQRVNGRFYIWGKIKERHDQKNSYILNINALVVYKEVKEDISEIIKKDILAVWYETVSFAEEIEIRGFDITADIIYIAVKYIVGIAALISGDPQTAVLLHKNLENDFSLFTPLPPNLVYVKSNLQSLIAIELLILARFLFIKKDYINARKHLEMSVLYFKNNYGAFILESIINFYEGKIINSLASVQKAEEYATNDGTWRYNKAFLYMYRGQYKDAYKIYKEISSIIYSDEDKTLKEIYEFNQSILNNDKTKIFCHFILGYLLYYKSANCPLALSHFESFLELAKNKLKYKFLVTKSIAYKEIIVKEMNRKKVYQSSI